MSLSPTWDVVSALLAELGNIRGSGSGYNLDFGGRVYTRSFNPAAGATIAEGFLVVRFTGEDDHDLTDGGEDDVHADLDLHVEAWLPETSQTPGVSNGLEQACRAGDDIVKAVNKALRVRSEVKSATVPRLIRGTGAPELFYVVVSAAVNISHLIDYASIGT